MNDHLGTVGTSDVLDRLVRLRVVLPLMAHDLAAARRRAMLLTVENERLRRRVAELESELCGDRQPEDGFSRRERSSLTAAR